MVHKVIKFLTYNLALKIGAFVIAILAWILVVNADDPIISEPFDNVPVNVINREIVTNYGMTYRVDNNATSVQVIIYAKRSVMDLIKQNPSLVTATADMSQMQLDSLIPITATVTGFEGRIHQAIAVPVNMIVTIEEVAQRNLPINANITGQPRQGFVIGPNEVSPPTVTITGPASMIADIDRVVARVDVTSRTRSGDFEAEFIIYDIHGNAMDQSLLSNDIGQSPVMVHVEILPTKVVPLHFSTSGRPGAGFVLTDISSEPSTIKIAATQDVLDGIESITIPPEAVNINDANSRVDIPVDVTPFLPEGVQLGDPEIFTIIVTVQIERAGTTTITVPVDAIIVQGLREDLSIQYEGITSIDLQFQGSQSMLALIQTTNLVSIDLSGITQAGRYSVPITVTTNLNVENISTVREIPIILSPRTETQ